MKKIHPYLFLIMIFGALVSYGCQGEEKSTIFYSKTQLRVLPADGLPDAEPVTAGLALDEKRVRMCQSIEEVRVLEGKLPPITIPAQPLKLRSEPRNARVQEVEDPLLKYNFNINDNARKGCFINAFRANSDGTLTDYATGLVWMHKPTPALSRADAHEYIQSLNIEKFAGHGDWRLPTTEEMASLVQWYRYGKKSYMDLYMFRSAKGTKFMTADTYKYEGVDRLWLVDVFSRFVTVSLTKDGTAHVLAVRSL